MKILYVNAIVCPIVGEIFKRGVHRAVAQSKQNKKSQKVEVLSMNCFYEEKSSPRFIGSLSRDFEVDAVILSGSEKNITDREDRWVAEYLTGLKDLLHVEEDLRDWMGPPVPVMGICFGHQALAGALGGEVARFSRRVDRVPVTALHQAHHHPIFKEILQNEGKNNLNVMVTHSDHVVRLPQGFHTTLTSDYCGVQGMAHDRWPIVSLQSHPELTLELKKNPEDFEDWKHVDDTLMDGHHGPEIIANFVDWAASVVRRG